MTVTNANCLRPVRRSIPVRTGLLGLAVGLLAAMTAVHAAPAPAVAPAVVALAQAAPATSADPAKQLPGTLSVSSIDFKRGDGGAGLLILHFSGDGALPDLSNQGSSVVVNVGNATLPATLQNPSTSRLRHPGTRIVQPSGRGPRGCSLPRSFESMSYLRPTTSSISCRAPLRLVLLPFRAMGQAIYIVPPAS